jgi:subtilisin family serine protease
MGVLVVCSVGNEGPGTSRSPGNYAEVLCVGASDAEDNVADFSSSQRVTERQTRRFERTGTAPGIPYTQYAERNVPDVVAPGIDVLSCLPGGRYGKFSGTAISTPLITGLAALLFQAKPTATGEEVKSAILESCELGPQMSPDRAGRGIPDGPRALSILLASSSQATAVDMNPRNLPSSTRQVAAGRKIRKPSPPKAAARKTRKPRPPKK